MQISKALAQTTHEHLLNLHMLMFCCHYHMILYTAQSVMCYLLALVPIGIPNIKSMLRVSHLIKKIIFVGNFYIREQLESSITHNQYM